MNKLLSLLNLFLNALALEHDLNAANYARYRRLGDGSVNLVKDIAAGAADSQPEDLTVFNGKLYFEANDGVAGRELWASDGTDAGTVMVKDINPGSGYSFPTDFVFFDNKLYFAAGSFGELWVSDGTEAGTVMLKDVNPYFGNGQQGFAVLNDKLFFSARGGVSGDGLWVTDGTEAGTVLVKEISVSPPEWLTVFNNKLYFAASDGTSGKEFWTSDGTEAGTAMVKDIRPGTGSSFLSEAYFTVFDDRLYFQAYDETFGRELWRSDGTEFGTIRVADINPSGGDSSPSYLTVFNNRLYFFADDGTSGVELWAFEIDTFFVTNMIKDINAGSDGSKTVGLPDRGSGMAVFDNKLYFSAFDGTNGSELWESDGTDAGTQLCEDINPGPFSSLPSYLIVYDGKLFFQAEADNTIGTELYALFPPTPSPSACPSIEPSSAPTPVLPPIDTSGHLTPAPVAPVAPGPCFRDIGFWESTKEYLQGTAKHFGFSW